ncbi:MAG: hypothetical protein KDE15_13340 [Erythrobacter sp.]|nr:hypothetical protein [Erythrobacter sp.]
MLARRIPTCLALACAVAATPALAQDEGYVAPRATAYEEVLALPDWTGTWHQDWSRLFGVAMRPIVLTPAAQAEQDRIAADYAAHGGPPLDHEAHCLPPGMPSIMSVGGMPMEVLYSPGRVTILVEAYGQTRRIFTDGRPLPDDPEPFFNGNSVGHWEGDVLVVETVGLHQFNSIARGIYVQHSDQARIDERIWQPAADELIVEMTVTDPEVLAEPYTSRIYFRRQNEFPIREYVCAENNRLTTGEDGANVDLGLDAEDDPFGPPVSD